MKDFAKSIVCNVKAEVAKIGNYDPKDYENDPRHKWTIKAIENEIQKYKQRIELNRVRMTQLRNMENSGNYPSSSRELKEEQKDYEANQMKVKQLVSMLRRATGNELPEDMVGNKAFQERTLQYAYEKAKSKGLSGKALEDETLRIATHAAPYDSSAHSDSLRREVQEFLLKVGNSKVGNGMPGAWTAYRALGAKRAEEKKYNGYTLVVETYDDKDFGKFWSWYLLKGDNEIKRGETTSPSGAKAAAEIALQEELRKIDKNKAGNSKVGNAIQGNPEEQAKRYASAYEAAKKNGDTEEMNKQKGYIKILRSQIKEELKEVEARRSLLNGANILLMGY